MKRNLVDIAMLQRSFPELKTTQDCGAMAIICAMPGPAPSTARSVMSGPSLSAPRITGHCTVWETRNDSGRRRE